MAKWKCGICGSNFENFHAQGFNNKIYCPLCYFKKENQELKKQLEERNIEYFKGAYDTHNKYYDQQQDLINWLEDKIHTIETTYSQINGNYSLMNEKLEVLKEVLEKYKGIMNGDDK
jgi:hypothetical protein